MKFVRTYTRKPFLFELQPQLHIHFLTATRDIFKKGISIRIIAG